MSRTVVTGAASGIGRATARLLLEQGATVVAADRDEAGLAAVAHAGAEPIDWEWIMPVNAKALFFLCQALVPRLQPHGAVVNVASGAGKTGSTHEAAVYGASKVAVLSVTRSLAHAYAGRGGASASTRSARV